ncbi:hypothetical protein BGZ95_004633 [Linnemannia exigua]|uniref:Uncharacterized protein n=1 Tax=Linnemannia exigua TaxID=604196 RepID=A0AAD4DH81_9FUNG|nr:hypothetical protein BGZ95_004633 [Linnemannia exigua]
MYQLPRLANDTRRFLCDKVVPYEGPPSFDDLPLDPLAPLPPPPPPPPPPAPLLVLNRLFHRTQMDTVQEQLQVMAIVAVEDNQDQDQDRDPDQEQVEDEDVEMMDASVDEFGFEE